MKSWSRDRNRKRDNMECRERKGNCNKEKEWERKEK